MLVLHRFGGRGRGRGVSVGETLAKGLCLFNIRDGKITRLVLWADRDRGLANLGLSAEGDAAQGSD